MCARTGWWAAALLLILAGCAGPQAERPPNVVLILADDQGCGDVGFTGNAALATPNLNRLAEAGTHFTRFTVAPVCAPTRASLLTGRYHPRTGVLGVIEGREFMVAEETTLAEHLQEAGYATALVGKWHLGENYPWLPQAQGFDTFVGFRDGSHPYFDVQLERDGRAIQTEGYLTDVLTDEAIAFVERRRDAPFFLYLAYNAPHSPLEAPERYTQPYAHLPRHTALIYGMMASVDENVGRLLDRLDALGLAEQTLVLFLSDNGPLYGGGGYERAERYNCGLRGTKYSVYEGGMRTPLLVRWPGRVPAGAEIATPAAHIDILPTILDYAGVPLPDAPAIDGRSLRPLVAGDSAAWPGRTLFMVYPGEAGQRGREPTPYPGGMARDGRYKMVDGTELYDLAADPGETTNLAAERPDVLARLDSAYRAHWQAVFAERPPYPRVHVGHAEENPAVLTAHWSTLSGGLRYLFTDDPPRTRTVGVHGDRIAEWTPEGRAVWRLAVQAAGRYRVAVRLRCPVPATGAVLRAELGGTSVEQPLAACVGPDAPWTEQDLGVAALTAGPADLALVLDGDGADLVVREVVLERLEESTSGGSR